jgi:hypothetical protein
MNKLNRKRRRPANRVVLAFASFALAACSFPATSLAQPRAVWSAAPVSQSNGTTTKMPLKRTWSRASNLSLSIDTRWTQNFGYRPVEITIQSPKAVAADRTISFTLYSGWTGTIAVEQQFKLPAGKTSETIVLPVPQYNINTQFYWWDVKVDGFADKDLSLKKEDTFTIGQGGYSSVSGISFLSMAATAGQRQLLAPNSMEFEILSLNAAEFPDRWILYTCFDAVTLSLDELVILKEANPTAFAAMQSWVRAGGHLWIDNVGINFEKIPELSKLLQLRESVAADVKLTGDSKLSREASDNVSAAGWRPLRFVNGSADGQVVTFRDDRTGQLRTVRDADVISRLQIDPNYSMVGQRYVDPNDASNTVLSGDSGRWFIEQPLGLGLVRAFRQTNDITQFQQSRPAMSPNAAANIDEPGEFPPSLSAALNSIGRWSARHGTAPNDANLSFSDLLVPGMGLAPVTEFEILITLFVLLIGPVNYFLLKRWGRLHLMVLTVPLAAAIVTLGLFAYAIISDGFGTTVRANSYTTLDQRTGESACWARLSYYSGLAPREGLAMPDDVALYPIIPDWTDTSVSSYVNSERDLKWVPGEGKLTRGWLRSRTPTQYLTVRARKSPMRLELTPVRDRMRAKNSINSHIEYVVVADNGGKLWMGEKFENGSTRFLESVERIAAAEQFRKIVADRSPQTPNELLGSNLTRRGRYASYAGSESMETNLASLSVADLAGFSGKEALALPPRTYVAITSTGPEVEFGMDGIEEEASFHIIVGQW